MRLGIGLVLLWVVFWTFAYVIDPYSSLKPDLAYMARITAWSVLAPCLLATVILGGWVAAGFRSS
jgi:heme A synthase